MVMVEPRERWRGSVRVRVVMRMWSWSSWGRWLMWEVRVVRGDDGDAGGFESVGVCGGGGSIGVASDDSGPGMFESVGVGPLWYAIQRGSEMEVGGRSLTVCQTRRMADG
jgi:hypothetical protein